MQQQEADNLSHEELHRSLPELAVQKDLEVEAIEQQCAVIEQDLAQKSTELAECKAAVAKLSQGVQSVRQMAQLEQRDYSMLDSEIADATTVRERLRSAVADKEAEAMFADEVLNQLIGEAM